MADLEALREKLRKHGQQHLLKFYDELDPARQAALVGQIEAIDFDGLGELLDKYVLNKPEIRPAGKIEPAPVIPSKPGDANLAKDIESARKHGEELILAGKVAAFTVAGGQGTRLGFEGPKGCLEATPVTRKPLFQVFAEQVLAASQRNGATVPWYVMTSPVNDVATRAFFRQRNHFGLDSKDVFFLCQGTMPAFSLDGKILMASKFELALSPNGHGGSLLALRNSGALDDMKRRGVEYISYFQVDNPLVHAIDPLFVGLHARRGAEMSAKALPKRDPMEKLGNFVKVDSKVMVIEYSDMPDDLANATTEDGRLRFSAGSIAIHVLSRAFVERLTREGRCELPFHRAEKKVQYIDGSGEPVKPDAPNAVKLEMFVFDALPMAKEVVIFETKRSEEFSPIKNAAGEDSIATSLYDQVRRAAEWLEQAGISVPRDADGKVAAAIEISPLYATTAAQLKQKVDPDLKVPTGQNLYLGSRGQTGGLR